MTFAEFQTNYEAQEDKNVQREAAGFFHILASMRAIESYQNLYEDYEEEMSLARNGDEVELEWFIGEAVKIEERIMQQKNG